jgi:hypothetical protein
MQEKLNHEDTLTQVMTRYQNANCKEVFLMQVRSRECKGQRETETWRCPLSIFTQHWGCAHYPARAPEKPQMPGVTSCRIARGAGKLALKPVWKPKGPWLPTQL